MSLLIIVVLLQLAANQVTVLRSTLADFFEELDRKLLSGRQTSRRPTSSKGRSASCTPFVYKVKSLYRQEELTW